MIKLESKIRKSQKPEGIVIKEYTSPLNGVLRVKWLGGKKILNTEHTNYSYGTLEDVLNYGLDFIPLGNVQSVLLLGMGAGCVTGSLKKRYNCYAPVTAVEADPVIIEIADKEFGISASEQLHIIQGDAMEYVLETRDTFDLVIIDIFVDLHVPEKFYSDEFWQAVIHIVSVNGFVLFNTGIDLTEEQINSFADRLPDGFLHQIVYNVYESNTLLILNRLF